MNLTKMTSYLAGTSFLIITALSGCNKSTSDKRSDTDNTVSATENNLVLSQERSLVAGTIWDREFNGSRPGTLKISVNGTPPYTVTLVKDSVYQIMVKENKSISDFSDNNGIYVNSQSDAESFVTSCRLDQGKYWISITNQSKVNSQFTLRCHSW